LPNGQCGKWPKTDLVDGAETALGSHWLKKCEAYEVGMLANSLIKDSLCKVE